MQELPGTFREEQSFDFAHLCRYFSELSPQPMVAIEGATHIVRYFNAAFTRFVGKESAELIGRPFTEVMPQEAENGCLALLERVYSSGTPEILQERERIKMPPSYSSYSAWPIFGKHDNPVGVVVQMTDATETVIFRRQVVAMNEQLLVSATRQHELTEKAESADQNTRVAEKANQDKSKFLSRMSHELRTPLNAILGFSQVLEMGNLTPGQKEAVGHISDGGHHLLVLVNEILDITRAESGEIEFSIERVALDEIVAECCATLKPLADEHDIRLLDNSSKEGACHVMADPQRLRQVLFNLLENAIKYNRESGEVVISVAPTTDQRLQVRVRDFGLGLTATEVGKLFTPLERLRATDSQIEGTGLGLVLSQRLMTAMGGTVGVESVLGQGSTFWVELPQA